MKIIACVDALRAKFRCFFAKITEKGSFGQKIFCENKGRNIMNEGRKKSSSAKGVQGIKGYDVGKIMRALLPKVAILICGYFAGACELPFGARPFGISLVSASGEGAFLLLLGACVSSVVSLRSYETILYIGVYVLILSVRLLLRFFEKRRSGDTGYALAKKVFLAGFEEPIGLRVVYAAIFASALGIIRFFTGGMLYYDLFGFILSAALSPLTALAVCGYTVMPKRELGEARRLYRDIAVLALCAICVFGARELNIYGASLSVVIALMATFYITCSRGIAYGTIGGLLLGLCYSPMLSPLFVIGAICTGVLARFSVSLSCFASLFACSAWAFYINGISALGGSFGGIISACLIYSALDKTLLPYISKSNERFDAAEKEKNAVENLFECRVLPDSALDGIRLREMNARRKAVSDGFYKLSTLVEDIESERNEFCEDNKNSAEKYNYSFSGLTGAFDYKALSTLLLKASECEENEYKTDRELSHRLCSVLTSLDAKINGVLVYGVRKKTVYIKGSDRKLLKEKAREIAEAIAPHLPFLIDIGSLEIRREGEISASLTLCEREKNSASVVRRRVIAKNESVCGDSATVFKNADSRFFAFISDGMGSGSEASSVSRTAVSFLCNMLSVGSLNEELISMLNSFLRGACSEYRAECSATLDLFELDLMNGHSKFYKCGAAPSYVYRKGRLFKLRSETMPVGILPDVDVKISSLELRRGDVIVMVSDGVTGEGEECPWLFELLSQSLPSRSLDRIAELIVKYATAQGSVDDISVLIVRIE